MYSVLKPSMKQRFNQISLIIKSRLSRSFSVADLYLWIWGFAVLLSVGSVGYMMNSHSTDDKQFTQTQTKKTDNHKVSPTISPAQPNSTTGPQTSPTPSPQPATAPTIKNPMAVTTAPAPSQSKSSTQYVEPLKRDVDFSIEASITSVISGRTFQLTVRSLGGEELMYFPDVPTDSAFRILAPAPPFGQYTSEPVTYNIITVSGTMPGLYNIGVRARSRDINANLTLKTVPITITAPPTP